MEKSKSSDDDLGLDLENITHFIYKPAALVPGDEYIHMKTKVPQ